jgi:Carbohydrate esterase, sialic acid-specific acetylesterase
MINWMAGNLRRAALALIATSACHVFAFAQPPAALATPATAAADVILTSPLDYQVFQRETRLRGTIQIRGRLLGPADSVEARVAGRGVDGPLVATWHKLSLDQHTGEFRADLKTAAGGFYEVDVRVQHGAQRGATLTVPHVGVGEVFVVSGQSNSTNYGEVPQVTETGMVTTFSGESWRLANDPQPGVQDNSKKGSFIPSFGDALYRRYRVPIGVASVGHGSTSVRQWLPAGEPVEVMPTMTKYIIQNADGTLTSDGTLFNGMMTCIRHLGVHGFRAVLWHQGESDSHQLPEHEITAETYRRMLEHVILATRSQAEWNIPWFVAQATYHTPEDTSCPPIREAQRSLWQSGVALEGPDTDTLTAAYRQNNGKGTHLNDAGLKTHGQLWAHQVELYLDPLLH